MCSVSKKPFDQPDSIQHDLQYEEKSMTVLRYLAWFFCVLALHGGITLLQYRFHDNTTMRRRGLLTVSKFVLASAVAAVVMVTYTWFAWRGGFLFGALYVALMGDVCGDLMIMLLFDIPYLIHRFRKKETHRHAAPKAKIQCLICAFCALLYLVYGTVNMQRINVLSFDVESDKLEHTYRAAFLADLHAGSSQSFDTSKETVKQIRSEDVDFVILGGDITDEWTTKEEMQEIYHMFKEFTVPVYFIYGNHDRQPNAYLAGGRTYSDEELKEALESNGIQVLEDEWIELFPDFILMARDDASTGTDRIDISEIPPRPEGKFVLLVDHAPYQKDDIIASKADLQLSGHTHAGQLFPLQHLYNISGYDSFGFYFHGDTQTFVSARAGGWLIPFRTEENCQYNVITFIPASDSGKTTEIR